MIHQDEHQVSSVLKGILGDNLTYIPPPCSLTLLLHMLIICRKRKADHESEEPAAGRDGHVYPICGELVAGKEQEHADYHLALELESGFGSGSSKSKASAGVKQKGAGQSDCNKRKQSRNMPTITSFFRPSGH